MVGILVMGGMVLKWGVDTPLQTMEVQIMPYLFQVKKVTFTDWKITDTLSL